MWIVGQRCDCRGRINTLDSIFPEIIYYIFVELLIVIPKNRIFLEICQLDDVIDNYVTEMHKF